MLLQEKKKPAVHDASGAKLSRKPRAYLSNLAASESSSHLQTLRINESCDPTAAINNTPKTK